MFRFFTVYGPWGRPDMALFKFTKAILNGEPIDVYNRGDMSRDFTYIDDLVTAIHLLFQAIPANSDKSDPIDSMSPIAPFRVVNIGNSKPEKLMDFISAIEEELGITAIKNLLPMQPGDVPATWADTSLLNKLTSFEPSTDLRTGVGNFINWYRKYYEI